MCYQIHLRVCKYPNLWGNFYNHVRVIDNGTGPNSPENIREYYNTFLTQFNAYLTRVVICQSGYYIINFEAEEDMLAFILKFS